MTCSTVVMIEFDASAVITAKNKPLVSKFLKDGVRGRKAFFQKFSSPPKKHKTSQSRFFFGTRGAKKKLGKKKTPFFMGSAQTRKFFEKNLTKNFQALVQCEHSAFDGRAQKLWQKNKSPASKFLKVGGVGEGKLLLRSFLPPHKK